MRICAVGDIMPGGVLNGTNNDFVSTQIMGILNEADIRVGTLETAIGNHPTFNEDKMRRKADVIYAKEEDLLRLKTLGMNVVSLANNHFTDLGERGTTRTIELLNQLGIAHCGAGENIKEASQPVVIRKGGKSYAFIAFCDWREETVGWCPFATSSSPGVNPMTDDHVVSEIKANNRIYDYVIVIPHWGNEYIPAPSKYVYRMAKKMTDAGADLILGGHTHCVQPIWRYKGTPVIFSMGNFLFPDRLLTYPRSTYYPETPLDVSKLPVTDGYPRYVDTVTFKRWKPMARYGMMVMINFSSTFTKISHYVTYLREDNFIELTDGNYFYSNKVRCAKKALDIGCYPLLLLILRVYSKSRRLFKRVFIR